MLCLILLFLLFSRRRYWGGYGYPYGAYSVYNPYFHRGYGYYGGYRPYGYW